MKSVLISGKVYLIVPGTGAHSPCSGDVKLPFVIAIPRPEGDLVFEVSKTKTNEAIRDSVFR